MYIKLNYASAVLLASVIPAILGSFLMISKGVQHEPSLGYFIFFLTVIVSDLIALKISVGKLKWSVLSLSLILSFLLINFGFIINTKSHNWNFFLLVLLLPVINANLTIDYLKTHILTRYLNLFANSYIAGKFDGINKVFKDFKEITGNDIASATESEFKEIVGNKEIAKRVLNSILIFLAIGIPLIIVVLILLASSSDTFSDWIGGIFDLNLTFDTLFVRLIFASIVAPYLIGEIMYVKLFKDKKASLKKVKMNIDRGMSQSIGMATMMIVFILNIFYFIFVIAQLKTDFGDLKEYVSEKNLDSFSQLAVSRFWELILVTLINCGIIYFGRLHLKKFFKVSIAIKYLGFANIGVLFLNTIFLIISVHQRLFFYIENYGFTYRRFIAYSFLPVLLILCVLMFYTVVVKKVGTINNISMSLMVLFFSLVIAIPTSYLINRINYSLGKDESITVIDPTYTVRNEFGSYHGRNSYIEPNNVKDDDGLLVAYDYLYSGDFKLSSTEKELLKDRINDFKNTNAKNDWREFNIMKWLIEKKFD